MDNGFRNGRHYFIGDKRIASRIGSGSFNNVYGQNGSFLTAGQQDYAERMSQIENQREDYYRELGIAPGIPTMKGSYGDPENTGVGYNTIIKELGDHTVPAEWAQYVKHNTEADTAPGAPIQWDDPSDPETALPGYGFVADNSGEPEETFYYHSDHLGSTSYITDGNGNITQYDAYLPYGELLVDEHSSSEDLPYKFNGKELDEETGLYYYGARYMQPVASIWYGVDPLTEKYPGMGGYVYCHANPVKLIDTDGRDILPCLIQQENYQGHGIVRKYRSNWNYMKAMKRFAQTTYGKQFIGGFLKKGRTQYGVSGTGKYSDVTLQIEQINFVDPEKQYGYVRDTEGSFNFSVVDGTLYIIMRLDTKGKSVDELTETITHELALHGSKLDAMIKAFKQGGEEAVDKLMRQDPGGAKEHRALGEKNMKHRGAKAYHKTMQELVKKYKSMEKIYQRDVDKYRKDEKD